MVKASCLPRLSLCPICVRCFACLCYNLVCRLAIRMHTSPYISLSFNCELSFPADQVRFWGKCVNRCVTLLTRKNSHKLFLYSWWGSNFGSLDLESDAVPIEPHRQFVEQNHLKLLPFTGEWLLNARKCCRKFLLSQINHFVKDVILYFKIM